MLKKIIKFLFILSLIGVLCVAGVFYWAYLKFTQGLPDFTSIEDYKPAAVSRVVSSDGKLVAEFFSQRRYPVSLSKVPKVIRNAVIAAEDASFYEHPGIDPLSILRAAIKNFESGRNTQGGSTITQQVVKNLLLSSQKTIERKIREAILAYRLEKKLTKDEILELYLNEIYFGNGAYGIKAAISEYFHKQLSDITLAEAAMIAGLPKAPTSYSPISHYDKAKKRQVYVLGQMVSAGFITKEESDVAKKEEVKVYRSNPNKRFYRTPYFLREMNRQFEKKWKDLDLDTDGLEVTVAVEDIANVMARRALQKGLRKVDKRRGWRGPLETSMTRESFLEKYEKKLFKKYNQDKLFPAIVTAISGNSINVTLNKTLNTTINVKGSAWYNVKRNTENDTAYGFPFLRGVRVGDIIELSAEVAVNDTGKEGEKYNFSIDQTPDIQGAIVLLDPHTGLVRAMVGGYDYATNEFNRAVQSLRQPGSAFKPFVYLAAIDQFNYNPTTIVYDEPRTFRVGNDFWTPKNFDGRFSGPITLQSALERSRNVVVADLISRIGLDAPIQYAKQLGVKTPLKKNLSIALGSNEVSLLEIVRAYGVFAGEGMLYPSAYIEKIVDRDGKEIYNHSATSIDTAKRAISRESAFIMAHMMKGVVERGTARKLQALKRPLAGKTGTTNDQMDAWFVGYTPEWACGVWVGFDRKKSIGPKETGGKVAAPIFLEFMREYLKHRDEVVYSEKLADAKELASKTGGPVVEPKPIEPADFSVPEGVSPFWVNRYRGTITTREDPGGIIEYFREGTQPKRYTEFQSNTVKSYLEDTDL